MGPVEDRETAYEKRAEAWVTALAEGLRAPASVEAMVDHFRPWIRADYRFRQPPMRQPAVGIEAFESRFVRPLFALIPEPRGRILRWAARQDVVFVELTLTGFVGRRPVRLQMADRFVLAEGKVAERETFFDPLPLVLAVLCAPTRWRSAVNLLLSEFRSTRTA